MRNSHTIKKIIRKRNQSTSSLLMPYDMDEYIRDSTELNIFRQASSRAFYLVCTPRCSSAVFCRSSREVAFRKRTICFSRSGGWSLWWLDWRNRSPLGGQSDYGMLCRGLYIFGRLHTGYFWNDYRFFTEVRTKKSATLMMPFFLFCAMGIRHDFFVK